MSQLIVTRPDICEGTGSAGTTPHGRLAWRDPVLVVITGGLFTQIVVRES